MQADITIPAPNQTTCKAKHSLFRKKAQATWTQRVTLTQAQQTRLRYWACVHRSLHCAVPLFKRCVVNVVTHTACVLQSKPVSPGAQPIRHYKGQSRQMVTMASLEKGGYFDVPIQVNQT